MDRRAPVLHMPSLSTSPASCPVPPALPAQHTRLLHRQPVYHHLRVDPPAPDAHGPAPVPSLRLHYYYYLFIFRKRDMTLSSSTKHTDPPPPAVLILSRHRMRVRNVLVFFSQYQGVNKSLTLRAAHDQVSVQAAMFVGTAQSSFSAFAALDRYAARRPFSVLPALNASRICSRTTVSRRNLPTRTLSPQ
eukprot:2231121-Pyramimonas_sp.AAC.1